MIGEKHQRLFVVFMTLTGMAFIVVILIFLFLPALKDVETLSQDVIDSQTELEAQYENRKNLINSISSVARIRQTTEELKAQFLKPGEELVFITRIETVATEHNLESAIRIGGSSSKKTGVDVLNDMFDLSLVGTYPDVLKAIRAIERLPNLTNIESVRMQAGDLNPEEGLLVITASVRGKLVFTPEGL